MSARCTSPSQTAYATKADAEAAWDPKPEGAKMLAWRCPGGHWHKTVRAWPR